ncbi:hypothetical protein BGZ94_003394 [Podila epigama]|nr:hypothetical protein BGZ94_003394 [Podila epigama]
MTTSTSFSSRLSSYSTTSLTSSSYTQLSDSDSYTDSARSHKKKKQSKEKQLSRCLCYLDTSLDNDSQQEPQIRLSTAPRSQSQHHYLINHHQHQNQHQHQHHIHNHLHNHQQHNSSPWSWYFQKKSQQKDSGRLRKMWNDSTIFHWSKPSLNRRWHVRGRSESHGSTPSHTETPEGSSLHKLMRDSASGTDISDEGNHSLSDIDDDDASLSFHDGAGVRGPGGSPRVSFQEDGTTSSRRSRHRDSIMAISRYQEAIGKQQLQEPEHHDSDMYGSSPEDPNKDQIIHNTNGIGLSRIGSSDDDEEDDDDEDWDIQSDSGAPSSKLMYSADAREPTSFSTVTLPLSPPPSKQYNKKASNANLNSLRIRQRCLSLPADGVPSPSLSGLFKVSSPTSSHENWDADFDIGSSDINVPTKVVENQLSLQMDICNIKDFALQIEDLKTLRTSLRKASRSLKAANPKKHQDLSKLFQRDWEQAEVIIDLGEIAQTSTNVEPTMAAAGPLSLLSGRKTSFDNGGIDSSRDGVERSDSSSLGNKRPSLSAMPCGSSRSSTVKSRSTSCSTTLTGATLVTPTSDQDLDGVPTKTIEPAMADPTDVEIMVESVAIAEPIRTSTLATAAMKESFSSPAGLGLCTLSATPSANNHRSPKTSTYDASLTAAFSSTATAAPIESNNSHTHMHAEVEASFRRYHKHHRHAKSRSRSCRDSSFSDDRDSAYYHGDDWGSSGSPFDDDDGYESYGHVESGSVGVVSPIPSDRHMQVLKDILMEGLGSDVARQFMFKQGEQDHVRFTVEVIPGLLGHLKGLQKRLVDQLEELERSIPLSL